MASMMMGGDFVEAYVLKNAYKEKLRRMEEAEARRKSSDAGAAAVEEEEDEARSSDRGRGRRGLFGLVKKKVHPGRAAAKTSSEASS